MKKHKVTILLPKVFEELYKRNLKKIFNDKYIMREIFFNKLYSKQQMIDIAADEKVLIVTLETIDRDVLEAYSNLKILVIYGVGFNNIDIQAAKEKGIFVTNSSGANAISVAELSLGLMLSAARNIVNVNNLTKAGKWNLFLGTEITHKTLGIVGLGKIGKELVKKITGFDMKILAYDVFRDEDFADKWKLEYIDIDRLASESDFISLHVPSSKENYHLIDYKFFCKMKKSAILINTARGEIVNENDLIKALEEKKIAGAALDVFENEPPSYHSRLFQLNNVVTTSHIGGSTLEAMIRIGVITLKNLEETFQGKIPKNNVYKV